MGGEVIIKNYKMLYDYNQILVHFNEFLKLDIYDKATFEWYSSKQKFNFKVEEIECMIETTVQHDRDTNKLNTLFLGCLAILIALFIGVFSIAMSNGDDVDLIIQIGMGLLLMSIIILLTVMVFTLRKINNELNKIHALLRMLKDNKKTIH